MLEITIYVVLGLIGINALLGIAEKVRKARRAKIAERHAKEVTGAIIEAIKEANELHKKLHAEEEAANSAKKVAPKKPAKAKK